MYLCVKDVSDLSFNDEKAAEVHAEVDTSTELLCR